MIIAVIGCAVGLAGWLYNRDKKVSSDAEWKGRADSRLDTVAEVQTEVTRIDRRMDEYGERIAKVETVAASAHKRLDEHCGGREK